MQIYKALKKQQPLDARKLFNGHDGTEKQCQCLVSMIALRSYCQTSRRRSTHRFQKDVANIAGFSEENGFDIITEEAVAGPARYKLKAAGVQLQFCVKVGQLCAKSPVSGPTVWNSLPCAPRDSSL